jgi:hypothetical protein
MGLVSKILRRAEGGGRTFLTFWCPGCDTAHQVIVAGPGAWWASSTIRRLSPSIEAMMRSRISLSLDCCDTKQAFASCLSIMATPPAAGIRT